MAYVGNTPSRGQWRKLTDISASFDGVTTTFTTSVPPGTSEYYVTAGTASQLIISVGGVIQEPDVDYSVSTYSITFTTAPAAGLSFFGILCGDALNTGVPSDGSITTAKLGGNLTVDLASGTAAAPSLTFDSNTGLFSPAPDEVSISTNGTERLRIDSAGQIEAVSLGTASAPTFSFTGDVNTGIYSPGADQLAVSTGGTGRLFIDSSGRLLIGISTARSSFYNGGTTPQAQFEGEGRISVIRNSDDLFTSALILGKSRSSGNTILQTDDQVGQISFQGNDGTNFKEAARITVVVDGTPGTNDMPGRLAFSTTADGASSPTERMRITQAGSVLFNTTSNPSSSGTGSGFVPEGDGRATLYMRTNTTGGRVLCNFGNPNGEVGSIQVSGTATSYVTSSDYRLKENVVAISNGIARLQQLKPSRFNFIADPATPVDGFIAHEVQTVVPEAITGEKDAVDDDGNPIYQGIDQSKLVPLLTAALQETVAKIKSLEARLTAAGI